MLFILIVMEFFKYFVIKFLKEGVVLLGFISYVAILGFSFIKLVINEKKVF